MSCERTIALLDDYVDGTLPTDTALRVRDHVAECAGCARELEDLRRLLDELGGLADSIEPDRDLWPSISARTPRRTSLSNGWWALLAASVVLGLLGLGYGLGVGVGVQPTDADPSVPFPTAATAPATPATARGNAAEPALATLIDAKQALRAALEQRRTSLPAETMATVDANLALIEKAIAEIRGAVERDPTNRELNSMLVAYHQREIDLLQRVTKAAARR